MKKYPRCYTIALAAMFFFGCKSVSVFPISEPSNANVENGLTGKWKFAEDTDKRNFYEVTKSRKGVENTYHVRFWDRGGTNPTYEANVFVSEIDNALFINVPYWEGHFEKSGYFFLKVLEVNADFTKMTTATVYDTTMRKLKSSIEVQTRIAIHLNDPGFYYDTVHFYKVL